MRRAKNRSGSALTEFALATPLLLMLLLVTIQYALTLNTMVTLSHLAREGARYAAVNPSSDNDIKNYIINTIAPAHIRSTLSPSNITITPTDLSQRVAGRPITVTITYDMTNKRFLPSTFLGVRIFSNNVTTQATMMIE